MVAVAIHSADPALRLRLEQLLRAELGYTVASVTNDPAAVSQLIEQRRVDTVVAHVPSRKLLTEWRNRHPATTFVVIAGETDEGETFDALYAGASAILPRSAASTEIATAIDMASRGETGRCQSPKVSLACLRKCQSRFGGSMPSTSAETTQPCCSSICNMPGRYSAASLVACCNS
jgi:DNA-binding NarL/FixJ family response regulator